LLTTKAGNTMTHTDTPIARESLVTPQFLHREAAVQLEKAVKHHRQAALLHDSGDIRQAETHGNIAYNHTAQALDVSGRALNVSLW
jgi:cytochrome c peroxidase